MLIIAVYRIRFKALMRGTMSTVGDSTTKRRLTKVSKSGSYFYSARSGDLESVFTYK